jgi:Lon protease-like protein
VLEELGDAYSCGGQKMDDALWVSGQLGQLLPISTGFRQRLLETDSARARLELLDAARSSES